MRVTSTKTVKRKKEYNEEHLYVKAKTVKINYIVSKCIHSW